MGGPLASALNGNVLDLTVIAKNSGGTFFPSASGEPSGRQVAWLARNAGLGADFPTGRGGSGFRKCPAREPGQVLAINPEEMSGDSGAGSSPWSSS